MPHRGQEGIKSLSRESAPPFVGEGDREHDGEVLPFLLHDLFGGIECRFGIEGIENRFEEEQVDPAVDECGDLFPVGVGEVVKCEGAQGGVVHVWRHRTGLVGRPYRAGHKTRLVGRFRRVVVGNVPGEASRLEIDFSHDRLHVVVAHRYAIGVECVGLDNIGSGIEIGFVYGRNDLRAGEAQQVVVPFLQCGNVGKPFASEIAFGESVLLYHRAHGTIEYHDSMIEYFLDLHDFEQKE